MAKNWAIVIGINQYRFLQPLRYAKRDAEMMRDFLEREAKFDRVFLFTDDSPPIGDKTTEPFRNNLLRVLRQVFAKPFMRDGDNFWFFFSGHGIRHQEQDYLMPLDGDPEDIPNTGIATHLVTNYLRSCGADNVVLILDACRNAGKKSGEGIGRQTEAEARQTGVISIFSCNPDQYSYEIEAIEQGAFTYSLLEGLSIRGRCATVERLNQYLQNQVPQLVQQHLGRAKQTPYTIAEPIDRSHLILMPQYAGLADIATLKNDAYRAQMQKNWDLAQRLWIRVLASASGQDTEAIEALQYIAVQKATGRIPPQPEPLGKAGIHPGGGQVRSTTLVPTILAIPQSDKDDLSSERFGVSYYAKLRDLLKASNWKEADAETFKRMLEVMNRQEEGYFRVEDIQSFPCQDLENIDCLWVKYSNGRFGFSVQKNIYLTCGAKLDSTQPGDEIWEKFGDCIGWHKQEHWVSGEEVSFIDAAAKGHLPAWAWWGSGGWGAWLFSRVEICRQFATTESESSARQLTHEDDLSSERFGANYYAKLRDLLKAGKWKEADQETADRMFEVMDRQKEGWFLGKDIQKFPCQDLQNIDHLWVKYSNGKFGFSVQKKIYLECGGKLDSRYPGDRIWKRFGDRVGWHNLEGWINYADVTFDVFAPKGHLPIGWCDWMGKGRLTVMVSGFGEVFSSLFFRKDL